MVKELRKPDVLILLEGADGAGKTTLADQLVSEIARRYPGDKVTLLHKGPPTSHPLNEYEHPLHGYRPASNEHVVCDRWHLGEVIYPRLLNRATQLDEPTLWHLELFLKSRGALLVHVSAPLSLLRERLHRDGDWLISDEHLAPLRAAYFQAIGESTLPTELEPTGRVARPTLDHLIQRALECETHTKNLNRFVTYVGPPFPSLLLLGDLRNQPGPAVHRLLPAFPPYPSTSGHYLLSALLTRGSRLSFTGYVGIANACDVDDPAELWRTLRRPRTVTLGVRASTAFHESPDGFTADHPQYVRRFHHRGLHEYADHLLDGKVPSWRS